MKVAVVGAGPVGLYAAHELVKAGHHVVLFEKGDAVAANVRSWGFVRLFSTLDLNVAPSVRETLVQAGQSPLDGKAYQTGEEFVGSVLEPLAAWLQSSDKCEVRLGSEIVSIGRGRFLKTEAIAAVGDSRRSGKPFRIVFRKNDEDYAESGFDVVLDASGSYSAATASMVGIGGTIAPGERAAALRGNIRRIIPNVKGADLSIVAGKRVAVVGTGYSAITCLKHLSELSRNGGQSCPKEVYWLTRRRAGEEPFQIMENDLLPQRSELSKFGNLIAGPPTTGADRNDANVWGSTKFAYVPAMSITSVEADANCGCKLKLEIGEEGGQESGLDVDVLFSLTGFRPDMSMWSELQVHTCYASDGPMQLAQTLLAAKMASDPSAAGDCLKQAAPGPDTLKNPEPNFFVLGMKSYGRNSTFLMRVGYEQVDAMMGLLRQT